MKHINTLKNVFGLALALVLFSTLASFAQVSSPVGVSKGKASQLVGWISDDTFGTQFQVTNMSNTSSVTVHIQLWASDTATGDPVTDPCTEINFTDVFTPNDTHVYDYSDGIVRNADPCNAGGSCTDFIPAPDSIDEGFFTVTPVISETDRRAIAFNHLFGEVYLEDDDTGKVNAVGRPAVSFTDGSLLADGTILDGVTGGYLLLRPDVLGFNFHFDSTDGADTGIEDATAVELIFSDNYSGPFGDYRSQPADATFNTLIFDEAEVPTSCQSFSATCTSNRGINEAIDDDDNPNSLLLCPGNTIETGWVRLTVTGLDGLENIVGVIALHEDDSASFDLARLMFAQGEDVVPTPAPTPTPTPSPTPTPDGSGGPTPTGGGDPGGGGGGGCAIAGPVQAGTALANMLIVLLPGAAFALRRRFTK